MTSLKRLAVVVVVALAGFGTAIVAFGKEAERACLLDADRDSAYSARFEDAVSMDESTHVLLVTRHGQPVAGAEVCLYTEMVGMTGMAMTGPAWELAPGRYGLSAFQFPMAGPWRATLILEEAGTEIGIPIRFHVAPDAMQ